MVRSNAVGSFRTWQSLNRRNQIARLVIKGHSSVVIKTIGYTLGSSDRRNAKNLGSDAPAAAAVATRTECSYNPLR